MVHILEKVKYCIKKKKEKKEVFLSFRMTSFIKKIQKERKRLTFDHYFDRLWSIQVKEKHSGQNRNLAFGKIEYIP